MKLIVPESDLVGGPQMIKAINAYATPGVFQYAAFYPDLTEGEWAARQHSARRLLDYIYLLLGPAARDYLISRCVDPARGPVFCVEGPTPNGYGYALASRPTLQECERQQARAIIAHALDIVSGRKRSTPTGSFMASLEAARAAGGCVDVPISYRNMVKINYPRGKQPGALIKGGKVERVEVKQTTATGAYALGMLAPPVGDGNHKHLNDELAARVEAGGLLLHGVEHRAAAVLLAAIYAAESGRPSPCKIDVCSVLTTQLLVNATQFVYAAGIAPHGETLRRSHLEELERVFRVLECVCLAPRAGQSLLRLISDHDTAGLAERYFAAPQELRGEVMFYAAIPSRMYYGVKFGDPLPAKLTDEVPVGTLVDFKYTPIHVGVIGGGPKIKAETGGAANANKEWASQLVHLAQVHFVEHGNETELVVEFEVWGKIFSFGGQLTKNPKRCREKMWAACKRITHLDPTLQGEIMDSKYIQNVRLRITRSAPVQPPRPKAASAAPRRRKKRA